MIKKQREKQYAVFGLGRFGTSVALTLNELGYQVMGVDTDEDNVQRLAHELTHVVTADSSDERTLRSLGAQNFDVAVVAIGDLEANMRPYCLRKLVFLWLSLKLSIRFMEKCSKKSALIRSFTRNVIWDSV